MSYHMRRNDREIKIKKKLYDIIKNNKYATIALCHDNEPYIVTLSYGFDEKNEALYFHSAQNGQKIDFIKKNNNVCLTIIEDKGYVKNKCEHPYKSIIIRGKIELVDSENKKLYGIHILLDHYNESKEKMLAKINTRSESWQKTQILKLTIEEITGKKRDYQE